MMEALANIQVMHGMSLGLILAGTVLVMILWNWQRDRDNDVDIKDLICTNGRIDEKKFMRFTAFVVSTWGFIYLIVDQRFSEWYFAGYMAAWTGNALFEKWIDSRGAAPAKSTPPPAPPDPRL